ncbi:DUF3558 domain-containing protein [Actinophytocola gossypii]|uniref:DUF3558 family protein n=1 Tax=Actinophytocola gossypii TaxID=2812003 RepID=A0ABT2J8W9_9PSEU|nr:DUF3558 domain-containing protein [Actinophytocola gossypii]MCT2583719.1 DUF3558 family protein [Actinophytocola gossypii]
MRAAVISGVAVVLLVLAGCADSEAGQARPEALPTQTGLPADYEAPTIADPLEPGRFANDPCALLSEERRIELGLPDAERKERFGTFECLLHPPGDRITTVQVKLMLDRGLADLVEMCRGEYAPESCESWGPTEVERYPAILDTGGLCRLMTGVAERMVVLVVTLEEPGCRKATEISETAVATLRESA